MMRYMTRHKLDTGLPVLACTAAEIIEAALSDDKRLLLFGAPGVGKSTLSASLAHELAKAGRSCWCMSADPGSPGFGPPGVIALGRWRHGAWYVVDFEGLCTLDAGRFRLPLVTAVRRLAQGPLEGVVLIDSPGVVRSTAGKELVQGLVEAASANAVLALTHAHRPPPLLEELQALDAKVFVVHASTQAARPGKRRRLRERTKQWDNYLANSVEQHLDLDHVQVIGTPPPLGVPAAWTGRQVALMQQDKTLAMGEVVALSAERLTLKLPAKIAITQAILVRDAQRNVDGMIATAPVFAAEPLDYLPPPDVLAPVEDSGGPRVAGRIGVVTINLANGLFGDPLLHIRLRHQRRSLLFDLGNGSRLPARIAHQVTDVFITHAHLDHIGGFLWLLRSRIGELPPCRLYGPPGLAQHVAGFIQGILWDRVASHGPVFEIVELHNERLQRFRVQAGGTGCNKVEEGPTQDGMLLQEPNFCVRAATLDHGTPVLAFAFEPAEQINIRKDRLVARGLPPGRWLGKLKQDLKAKNNAARIQMPNGTEASVAELAAHLALIRSGKRLVYATDFADTQDNRQRLVAFAQHAHTFFCEASFTEADAEHAVRTSHLTTRGCGEIAREAGVARLVPFHFSRRYVDDPQPIYEEVAAVCGQVVLPKSMSLFESTTSQGRDAVLELDAID
jgi:ribonuclease Z